MSRLDDLGEDEVVSRFRNWLRPEEDAPELLGDDCAVIPGSAGGYDDLLTSDAVVEGVHFESGTDLGRVGRKAVSRTLSDIAAMGGSPLQVLLNIGAPPDLAVDNLQVLMTACRDRAAEFGAVIAGGDLSRMDVLEVHVFCRGQVPQGTALLRGGAGPGDGLFVTGRLGGSLQGHHLDFLPRIAEAKWLKEHAKPTAMMDLSDGLAADLPRLAAESRVGARVNASDLPVSPAVEGGDPMRAMQDGEDYELLFTASREEAENWAGQFEREFGIAVTRIGEVTAAGGGLVLVAEDGSQLPWPQGGYKHF